MTNNENRTRSPGTGMAKTANLSNGFGKQALNNKRPRADILGKPGFAREYRERKEECFGRGLRERLFYGSLTEECKQSSAK